jgi:hypothetical protein
MKRRPFARMEVTNEPLTANAGLAVIGQLMRIAGIGQVYSNRNNHKEKISNADIIKSICGLISSGKVSFDHIKLVTEDPYFKEALEIGHMPKEATLRLRFESMSQDLRIHDDVATCSMRLLSKTGVLPEPTEISGFSWVRVDTDTSIFDNSNTRKEGVEIGYTKVAGYAPICSFLEGGLVVGAQLRPGAQNALHEGHETYFSAVRDRVRELFPDKAMLWVADAAFDDISHMSCRQADGDFFIIKRNPRRAAKKPLIALAKEEGCAKRPRPGKTVFTGETLRKRGDMSSLRLVYEVTERTSKKGQQLLFPEYTIFSIWTNLPSEIDANAVLQMYSARGTCEQYFTEIKSELDLERLPSGKFSVNALFFQLGMFVNNMLRVIGSGILSNNVGGLRQATRRRLRTVMQNLMYLCGRIVRHARSIVVKVKSSRGFGEALCEMYRRYCII